MKKSIFLANYIQFNVKLQKVQNNAGFGEKVSKIKLHFLVQKNRQ